jgi:hypothetical protein
MTNRRFPAPWRADKMPDGYRIKDDPAGSEAALAPWAL